MRDERDPAAAPRAADPDPSASSRATVGRLGTVVLCLWWGAMFFGTHVPLSSVPGDSPVPDKLIHFLMYFGLGWLLPVGRANREPPAWRQISVCLAGIVVYAVIDELLQIPVGRTAEWWDGVADVAGAVCGLLFARWRPLRRR